MPRIVPGGRLAILTDIIMRDYLQVKRGEEVLLAAPTEADQEIVQAFYAAASAAGAETTLVVVPAATRELMKRPTKVLFKAVEACDIYIPFYFWGDLELMHSPEIVKFWYEKKMRIFLVKDPAPGSGLDYMFRALREYDLEKVGRVTQKILEYLTTGSEMHITSKAGTDVTASIKGQWYRAPVLPCNQPGMVGDMTGVEIGGGPNEGTTEGVVVVDGAIGHVSNKPFLSEPVRVTIKKGRVVDVTGGQEGEQLRKLLLQGDNMDNIAEFSVGAGPFQAVNGDIVVNDKKVLGTMHVAFGDNRMQTYPLGTKEAPSHIDAMMVKPSLWIDGKQILDNGKLLLKV